MSKSEIIKSAESQIGEDSVYYASGKGQVFKGADGVTNYPVIVKGSDNASDMVELLRALPSMVVDAASTSEMVAGLVEVIALQQAQIKTLQNDIETLSRATVAIEAQKNITDAVLELAENGSDVRRPKIEISMQATTKASTSKKTKSKSASKSSRSASTNVSTKLKGLIKSLGELHVDVSRKTTDSMEAIEDLDQQIVSSEEKSYQGDMIVQFESITGNPLVKAEAQIMINESKIGATKKRTSRPAKKVKQKEA